LPLFLAALCISCIFGVFGSLPSAHAQTIVETVNGKPITDLDVGQRMKLLKVLRQPATREAALQSLIDDQVRDTETSQFQIKPTDTEVSQQIMRTASEIKIPAQQLFADLQHSGVSEAHVKEHFSAVLAFYMLTQYYHKGVEISEEQIRAELAKQGGKSAVTQYKVQQVIFIVPSTALTNMAVVKSRMEAAEQFRTRFTDCASGLPMARNTDNVAVKEEVVRDSVQLAPQIKQLLDKTPTGHLTPPQRTSEGIEMIAVCSKGGAQDDTALRSSISERLLGAQITADAASRLKELRARAIVVKK
jgi:peptidyl-prolyl cis-trans isomerase SurA